MKRGRSRKSRLLGFCASTRLERRRPTWHASTASPKRRFTTGRPSTAAWKYPKPSGCGRWKTRTASCGGFWRDDARQRRAQRATGKKMVGPAAKRDAVALVRDVLEGIEVGRRACSLVAADRKMIRYRTRRPPDTELRARLRELANQRRRFGYRRLYSPVARRRRSIRHQPHLPALPRGGAGSAQTCETRRKAAGSRTTSPRRGQTQCPLVPRLCPRPAWLRSAFAHPQHC